MKPLPRVIVEDELLIAFSLVDNYEAGKVESPIRSLPRDEWGISIHRKTKYTDLIDLANVDGMGWDRGPF